MDVPRVTGFDVAAVNTKNGHKGLVFSFAVVVQDPTVSRRPSLVTDAPTEIKVLIFWYILPSIDIIYIYLQIFKTVIRLIHTIKRDPTARHCNNDKKVLARDDVAFSSTLHLAAFDLATNTVSG